MRAKVVAEKSITLYCYFISVRMTMRFHEYTTPEALARFAFYWSEARLVIAAVALFLGGIPPVIYFLPVPGLLRVVSPLLALSWLLSGIVSAYLLYRWNQGGKKVFGGRNQRDLTAFFLTVVTGLNLGLVPIVGSNIGMSLSSSKGVFVLAGIVYILVALYLWKRWTQNGEKLF